MHDQGIIHGDLRGVRFRARCLRPAHSSIGHKANILIHHSGHACLAGFSLLTIASDQPITPSILTDDAIPWMGPELIDPSKFNLKESRLTTKSDCYALGMVIYEVLSGQVPFSPYERTAIIPKVLDGERPGRPQEGEGVLFTDGLWRMLGDCWKSLPDDRPSLDVVLGCLQDGGKLSVRLRRGRKEGWASKFFHSLKAFKFSFGGPRGP